MSGEEQSVADEPTGARAVQELLIGPLEAEGLRRSKRVTATDHAEFLAKLKARLRYMEPDSLTRLVPLVRACAESDRKAGLARDCWPGFAAIWNLARTIQVPPPQEDEILWSWLHSVEGPRLRDAGDLVATMSYIRRYQRPPLSDYARRQIADAAAELNRDRTRIAEAVALGEATPDQRTWLDRYTRAEAECLAIVEAGERHRAAKAEEAA